MAEETPVKNRFGTFGGVFTPSILTIFGLIMFMRANYIIGNAGVIQSILILSLCCGITFLTGLSISAISTNTPVSGGGAYFLISRVLGPGFGTAIGIALFLANALSVPFYILGFVEAFMSTEAITKLFPGITNHFLSISLLVLVVLFVLVWIGASWVIKLQYGILAILLAAIAIFIAGGIQNFNTDYFQENLDTGYDLLGKENLWSMFALYFPAVTGIMAGVNMSGDLDDPSESIPKGTLAAIILSFFVYALQIVVSGGMAPRADLIESPYVLLVSNAIFGLGFMVTAGVFCATLSSAIGSNLGAPRVLQAVGRDRVLGIINPFAKGSRKGDEPRRALLLTAIIGAITLVFANQVGAEGLNLVGKIVAMVFLYTYGMINLAAFVESLGHNPSFRPRFKFFNWITALIGGVGCIWSAFMINTVAATLALLFIMGLFYIVRNREMSEAFGDARRGFVFSRVSNNLIKLSEMPMHPKNWRPTILMFTSNPYKRQTLVSFARWMGRDSGLVSLVYILIGELKERRKEQQDELHKLQNYVQENELKMFPEVIIMQNFDEQLSLFLQAHSIGPIKPNIVLMGWPVNNKRLAPYFAHLRTIHDLGKSIVVVIDKERELVQGKRIDLWWRGQQNGSMMIILAHLIMLNPEWSKSRLRLMRQVANPDDREKAYEELQMIVEQARIKADIQIIVSNKDYKDVLQDASKKADLLMLGLSPPGEEFQEAYFDNTNTLLEGMPTTMLVYSTGEADLEA